MPAVIVAAGMVVVIIFDSCVCIKKQKMSWLVTNYIISHVNYLFTYAPTVSIKRIPAESDADNALRRHHPFDAYDYAYYS